MTEKNVERMKLHACWWLISRFSVKKNLNLGWMSQFTIY